MKPRHLYLIVIPLFILVLFSCKKKEAQTTSTATSATLNAAAAGGLIVSTHMQSFVMSSIGVAADSGHVFFYPSGDTSKIKSASTAEGNDWIGPDANGWYTRSNYGGLYDYTERLHLGDTIDYTMDISSHNTEGSYESKTTARYIKETKQGKTLYNGYSTWDEQHTGFNEISHIEWNIAFKDWNPSTSAGTYDWFWGVSENSGGNTVPYHCFLHIEATESTTTGWLHCMVIFYDNSGHETWRFEYDTPWIPVQMPQIPGWN
jgi:hypothetical protein